MEAILLLILSILPVFLIGLFIRIKDKPKEPIGLIIKLFFCGLGSIVLTLLITLIISIFYPDILSLDVYALDINLIELFFLTFFGIALVEEFSKWFFVYIVSYNHKHFDETFDMIVYAVFVSLGFACLENILYVFNGGIKVALLRAVLSVPGHAANAVFMGYYLSKAKMCNISGDKKNKRINMLKSILVPTLMHGTFDFLALSNSIVLFVLLVIYVILMCIFVIIRVVKASRESFKFKYKYNFCGVCGRRIDSRYCPICGSKNE
ncbi:MAG: PrsW family intramembrane metalloprotease [Bacilli bacterium]|nr:PrsW family intramembrane metalloprotease [Bacilli bacterium]